MRSQAIGDSVAFRSRPVGLRRKYWVPPAGWRARDRNRSRPLPPERLNRDSMMACVFHSAAFRIQTVLELAIGERSPTRQLRSSLVAQTRGKKLRGEEPKLSLRLVCTQALAASAKRQPLPVTTLPPLPLSLTWGRSAVSKWQAGPGIWTPDRPGPAAVWSGHFCPVASGPEMCWETKNRKPGLRFAHATARGARSVKVGYATAGGVGGFPSWWYGPVAWSGGNRAAGRNHGPNRRLWGRFGAPDGCP